MEQEQVLNRNSQKLIFDSYYFDKMRAAPLEGGSFSRLGTEYRNLDDDQEQQEHDENADFD